MTLFFTADTHFGHANVITYSGRPFASIEEHDADLARRWNAVVGRKDEVWHLGDFAWWGAKVPPLNGRIHLVLGNHDRKPDASRFESVQDVKYLRVQKKRFYLSHYAHRTWRKSNHGGYHLHGHSHGGLPPLGRSCDVGVDCWAYAPVSLDEILRLLGDAEHIEHHPPGPRWRGFP